jgi:hypothetical protein
VILDEYLSENEKKGMFLNNKRFLPNLESYHSIKVLKILTKFVKIDNL